MSVSPLQHISNFESYKSGEVIIDPSAAIAPGVVLKADPNSQIIIGKGVCIGMGGILHARDGILEVEAGANLGAGVLVVGKGKIGVNACVGSATTIVNHSIEPEQVVASGSIIGDTSRQVAEPSVANNTHASSSVEVAISVASEQEQHEPATNQLVPKSATSSSTQVVYGKASFDRLMLKLFPHKQSLSQPPQGGASESNST